MGKEEEQQQEEQADGLKDFLEEVDAVVAESGPKPEEEEEEVKEEKKPETFEDVEDSEEEEDDEGSSNSEEEDDDNKEEEDSSDDGEGDGESSASVSDAELERAVKAGLSLEKARKFAAAGALDDVLEAMEASNQESEDQEEDDEDTIEIPDLDPEEHDASVIAVVDALRKKIENQDNKLASQRKEMQTLRESKVSAGDDWLAGQIDGLDSVTRPLVTAAKKSEIEKRVSLLEAGYKAMGESSPAKSSLFEEAVQHVLGAEISEAKTQDKVQRSKKRSQKVINSPRESSGKTKESGGTESERAEEAVNAVAAMIAQND